MGVCHFISCPVASVLYSKGKEEGRRKREEGRGAIRLAKQASM
ncbi:hypothetical protein [Okeania sp. KiyG1]|nr:hypothetical protein [Okeania sp. KiyG1]